MTHSGGYTLMHSTLAYGMSNWYHESKPVVWFTWRELENGTKLADIGPNSGVTESEPVRKATLSATIPMPDSET